MAFDYAKVEKTANSLITNFGQKLTLNQRNVWDPGFNPITGKVNTDIVDLYDCIGVILPAKPTRQLDDKLTQDIEANILLSSTYQGNFIIEPIPLSTIKTENNIVYEIITCDVLTPAGLNILYKLEVKKSQRTG